MEGKELSTIKSDYIFQFLTQNTEGQKQSTKRFKYTLLKTLFNFIKHTSDPSFVNPCDTAVQKKTFRLAKGRQWVILEKDAVDEVIFRTDNPRDRFMLELMANRGMRIGEILKLRMMDVDGCKLFLVTPKVAGKIMFIKYMSRPQASCVIRRKTERKNAMAEAEIYNLIIAGTGIADSAPENDFIIEGSANVIPVQGGESQYGT